MTDLGLDTEDGCQVMVVIMEDTTPLLTIAGEDTTHGITHGIIHGITAHHMVEGFMEIMVGTMVTVTVGTMAMEITAGTMDMVMVVM